MFSDIKQRIENVDIKIKIGGALSVAVAIGWLYYIYKKPTKTSKTEEKIEGGSKPTSRIQPSENDTSEKILIKVINQINRVKRSQGNNFGLSTVKAIYNGQNQISKKQFIQLTQSNRRERRKFIKDLNHFHQLTKSYDENLESLHNNNLNRILAHYKIDKGVWMDIINQVSVNNKDQWQIQIIDREQREFDALRMPDKPKVQPSVLIDVFKWKINKLKENFDKYKEMVDSAPRDSQADLYFLFQKHLDDLTYQKFKLETEDICFSKKSLNEQQLQALNQLEEEVRQQLNKILFGDVELEEEI